MSAEHSPAIHWRLNPQRYRLQGIRFTETGEVSLQNRPVPTGNPNHIYNPPQEIAVVTPEADVVATPNADAA